MSRKRNKIPPRQPVSRLGQPGVSETGAERATNLDTSSALAPTRVGQALSDRCSERGVTITADNLPVLNAFSEFLEMERCAERRRFRGLLVLFVMLLAVAVVAALLAGRVIIDQFKGELTEERQRSDAVRQQLQADLTGVSDTARDLQGKLQVRDRAVRHTYSTLQQHMHGQTNAVAQIHDGMSAMELEMAMLENTIRELTQRLQQQPAPAAVPETQSDDVSDIDLDARIADDFARLRSLGLIAQPVRPRAPPENGAEREVPSQVADPRPHQAEQPLFSPPSDLTVETPSGERIPWRLGTIGR